MVELLSFSAAQWSKQHHIDLDLFSLTDPCSECAILMTLQSLGMVGLPNLLSYQMTHENGLNSDMRLSNGKPIFH